MQMTHRESRIYLLLMLQSHGDAKRELSILDPRTKSKAGVTLATHTELAAMGSDMDAG